MNPQDSAIKNVGQNFSSIDIRGMTPTQVEAVRNIQKNFAPAMTTPPAVVSPDRAESETIKNQNRLTEITNNQRELNTQNQTTTNQNQDGDSQLDSIITNLATDPQQRADQIGQDMGLGTIKTQLEATTNSINNQINLIDSFRNKLDENNKAVIDNIKLKYQSIKQAQEQANQAVLQGVKTAGFRSGRARYASELQDQIISTEINSGLKRLSDIEVEEQELILKAQQANDEKQFSLLSERMATFDKLREEKNKIITDMYRLTSEQEQFALQKANLLQEQIKEEQSALENYAIETAVLGYEYLVDANGKFDDEAILQLAEQTGVSAGGLKMELMKIQRENEKDLPAVAQEYNFAKEQGFKGSFLDYQSYKSNLNKTVSQPKGITKKDVEIMGWPKSLVGYTDRQVLFTFTNPTPPVWFMEQLSSQKQQPLDFGEVQKEWDSYRSEINSVLESANILKVDKKEDDIFSRLDNINL